MRLERQTPLTDNIFRIEPVSEGEYANILFRKKINRMEREALDEIKSLVGAAKDGIYPKRHPLDGLYQLYGLNHYQGSIQRQLQQLGNYGAAQANARNPFITGIFGF